MNKSRRGVKTNWHKVSTFGKNAEKAKKYLKKGDLCCVMGSIHTDVYEKDGTKQMSTRILAERITYLFKPSHTKSSIVKDYELAASA